MKVTDIISITELSRLLKKSRPTVYKYISDFERGNDKEIPYSVKKLFQNIQSGNIPKREIYEYCNHWFGSDSAAITFHSSKAEKPAGLKEIIKLLREHERKLDFTKLKKYIEEEIRK